MAGAVWVSFRDPAAGGAGAPSAPGGGGLAAILRQGVRTLAQWSRGLVVCVAGAAVMQGVLSGLPVWVLGSVPFAVPISAVVIAWVGMLDGPQWGPIFAALTGLLADAGGARRLGTTAWAYLPVAALFALVHRRFRRDHTLILVLYATAQAMVQTGGTYAGLRLAHLTATPGDAALAGVLLTALAGMAAAALAGLVLRFVRALAGRLRSAP